MNTLTDGLRRAPLLSILWTIVLLISIVLAARRLDGGLTAHAPTLLYAILVLAAAGSGARWVAEFLTTTHAPAHRIAAILTALIPALLFLAAVPPTNLVAPALLALIVFAAGWSLWRWPECWLASPGVRLSIYANHGHHSHNEPHEPAGLQWSLTRSAAAGGAEEITGRIVAEFAAGQRQTVLHVPFQPPLPAIPGVTAVPVEGDLQVKVAAVYTYGARLEVRRPSGETPGRAPIEFHATT